MYWNSTNLCDSNVLIHLGSFENANLMQARIGLEQHCLSGEMFSGTYLKLMSTDAIACITLNGIGQTMLKWSLFTHLNI